MRCGSQKAFEFFSGGICMQLYKHCKATEKTQYKFSSCYHKGKINLPRMTPPPENINNLYFKNTADSKNFKENIIWVFYWASWVFSLNNNNYNLDKIPNWVCLIANFFTNNKISVIIVFCWEVVCLLWELKHASVRVPSLEAHKKEIDSSWEINADSLPTYSLGPTSVKVVH